MPRFGFCPVRKSELHAARPCERVIAGAVSLVLGIGEHPRPYTECATRLFRRPVPQRLNRCLNHVDINMRYRIRRTAPERVL